MQQGFFSVQQTCSVCSGTGQVIKDKCRTCGGAGAIKENKTLSVNIPAGVDNGDKVRLSGEGEWMKDGQTGDLYVAIRVTDHPIFERDGRHLYIEAPIPFDISVIGGSIKIPTLENNISLKIPSNTQTGKVFRIKGKGASIVRDRRRGDILCRVIVETPSNLSKNQIEALNDFRNSLDIEKNYPGSNTFSEAISKIKE
jgi:molecular chaperone DnaJ